MEQNRDYFEKRCKALESERSTWDSHYKDIRKVIFPRTGHFLDDMPNEGDKRHQDILDETGTFAAETLAAGMVAGNSSPARRWFRLQTSDPKMMKIKAVSVWLDEVTEILMSIFEQSNVYQVIHAMYEELGVYGTASSLILQDFEDVVFMYPMTVGEYYLSQNFKGQVDTMYRQFKMKVGQMVPWFGLSNVSITTRNLWNEGKYDEYVAVVHAVEPRHSFDPDLIDNQNMPWLSVYYEPGENRANHFLRTSGFKRFRVLAPRWKVRGPDIYGHGPGMNALGSIRQLQFNSEIKDKGMEYQANPPIQVPTELRNSADTLPGGVMYYDQNLPQGGIRSAFDVDIRLDHVLLDIKDVRERIQKSFFSDLFRMMVESDRRQITAREIDEKHEEKLLILGPVLERNQHENLDKIIENGFSDGLENGIFPDVPDELDGVDIKIQYVSMLAQAQRAIGLSSTDRLLGTIFQIETIVPGTRYKADLDKIIDDYAEMLGVPADHIVATEKAVFKRGEEARAAQQAQLMEQAKPLADANKTIVETDQLESQAEPEVAAQFTAL